MKVFVLVWLIVWAILVLVGWVWYYFDRKNEKHKKAPIALLVIGNLMMAIYFLVLLPLMRRQQSIIKNLDTAQQMHPLIMEIKADKQTRTIKKILYVILFVGSIWMCVDSFCDYLGDHKLLHLSQSLFFLLYIIFFGWQAVVDYKRNKENK